MTNQGSPGSLGVAVPSTSPKVGGGGGGEGTAKHGTLPEFFFINATSKLVTKLQAICDCLIQHSNRISKLSGLSKWKC